MSGSTTFQLQQRPTPITAFQGWNSAHTNAQIALSNGNLTAAMTGATAKVKAFGVNSFSSTSGRYYFEIVVNY
jgi:hypothetical protein